MRCKENHHYLILNQEEDMLQHMCIIKALFLERQLLQCMARWNCSSDCLLSNDARYFYKLLLSFSSVRTHSLVVERYLHTVEVSGSNPDGSIRTIRFDCNEIVDGSILNRATNEVKLASSRSHFVPRFAFSLCSNANNLAGSISFWLLKTKNCYGWVYREFLILGFVYLKVDYLSTSKMSVFAHVVVSIF